MSFMYNVFEHLKQLWMGIWRHIHSVTTTAVSPDLGEFAEILDDVNVEMIPIKVLIAKARWAAHVCSKIHDMRTNPCVAWEYNRLLTSGSTAHHKKKVKMAMKMANGKPATNDKDNMAVFGPHFERVFNNHHPVDPTILDEIPQRPILHKINFPHHL
jgi:hypothetical protein